MPAIFHLDGSGYNPKPSEVNSSLFIKCLECGPRICLTGVFFKASYSNDNQASPSSLFCSSSLLEPSCCYESIAVRFCLSRRIQPIQCAFGVNSRWHFHRHKFHHNLLSILWVYKMDGNQQARNSTSSCPSCSLTGFFCCENYWPVKGYFHHICWRHVEWTEIYGKFSLETSF